MNQMAAPKSPPESKSLDDLAERILRAADPTQALVAWATAHKEAK